MKKSIVGVSVLGGMLIALFGYVVNVFADDVLLEDEAAMRDEAVVEDEAMEDEADVSLPELFIKAVNPGYTVGGVANTGEMIEIKSSSDKMISLAGATVGYTNSSGNHSVLYEFPENSWITGESILLRLASSPGSGLAAVNYTKTIAMKGELYLALGDDVLDSVCFTGKAGCYKDFKSSNPTVLARNEKTGLFEHVGEYEPNYDEKSYYVEEVKDEEGYGEAYGHCRGLEFSEILSYYETAQSEQFIEVHNNASWQISLDGCTIRYKNKKYKLSGVVEADGYFVYFPVGFSLTKNPTNSNLVELVDEDGAVIDSLEYLNGQKKGTSYAMLGYDEAGGEIWRTTFLVTPGAPNGFQEFKTCEEGKVINVATGNCVKMMRASVKTCPAGQYLNILTGRCKKKESSEIKQCKEGYYLNPETGRCKKIKENVGEKFEIKPEEYEEKSSFVALYIVIGVVVVGLGFLVFQFRHEIRKLWRRVFR